MSDGTGYPDQQDRYEASLKLRESDAFTQGAIGGATIVFAGLGVAGVLRWLLGKR